MRPRSATRTAVAIGVAWMGVALAVPVLGATCGITAQIVGNAKVAFVGTLTAASGAGDLATFTVTEVWGPEDLPAVVQITSTPGQWSTPPSGPGPQQFLVLADPVGGSLVVRFECDVAHATLAFPWDPSYAALRPATAHPPGIAESGDGVPAQLLFVIGVAGVLVLVSVLAFRRTRDPGA